MWDVIPGVLFKVYRGGGGGESLLYAVFRRKGTFFVYHLLTKYGSPFHITY